MPILSTKFLKIGPQRGIRKIWKVDKSTYKIFLSNFFLQIVSRSAEENLEAKIIYVIHLQNHFYKQGLATTFTKRLNGMKQKQLMV